MLSRRQALKQITAFAALVAGGLTLVKRKKPSETDFPVRLLGPTLAAGHRLRSGDKFPEPSATRKAQVVIVGGGIAGLSAAWRLKKKGATDFHILELEPEIGGNSRSGRNSVSRYPWGAHYVTLLSEEASIARELLSELGIITSHRGEATTYNEYDLCHAPHERLYIARKWQEGLVPKIGTSAEDTEQTNEFFRHVEEMRFKKGRDQKPVFAIPLEFSSRDPELLKLDQITIADYMWARGWNSQALHWYVNYCCRDDYGTPHTQTSAWAGLHYFSSRRSQSEGAAGTSVITWPEGNGRIVDGLESLIQDPNQDPNHERIHRGQMAIRVQNVKSGVEVDALDTKTGLVTRWQAQAVIVASPRFIAARLGPELTDQQSVFLKDLSYSPWVVANITLKSLPVNNRPNPGAPLSWDNVIYQNDSLGYVVANHQDTKIHSGETVWTYYRPLDALSPAEAREEAIKRQPSEWREIILADLGVAHPDLTELITSMDVWVWGHAMIRPTPGFIWGETRRAMQKPLGKIHFAHSDMSGLSLFEEANFHGARAADEVISHGLT